uniref:RRM domain-containing protein n=1 Tax=Rhabditophanes sp. KR3021 TaxID=114890 RepID=A0AC35UE53_9BILA
MTRITLTDKQKLELFMRKIGMLTAQLQEDLSPGSSYANFKKVVIKADNKLPIILGRVLVSNLPDGADVNDVLNYFDPCPIQQATFVTKRPTAVRNSVLIVLPSCDDAENLVNLFQDTIMGTNLLTFHNRNPPLIRRKKMVKKATLVKKEKKMKIRIYCL